LEPTSAVQIRPGLFFFLILDRQKTAVVVWFFPNILNLFKYLEEYIIFDDI
jgi:hypothetical protein